MAYAKSACATKELKLYKDNVDRADMTPVKKPTTESDPLLKFKSAKDTKQVDFTPSHRKFPLFSHFKLFSVRVLSSWASCLPPPPTTLGMMLGC